MPQINTTPKPTKPLIDATIPGSPFSPVRNISDEDKRKYLDAAELAAQKRNDAVALETSSPKVSSLTLTFQLKKFGKHWQGYAPAGQGKMKPLLAAPSLLISALDALADEMYNQGFKA